MLRTRLITAAVVLPIMIFGILKMPTDSFIYTMAIVAAVGMLEVMTMYKAGKILTVAATVMAGLCVLAYGRDMFIDALLFSMLIIGVIRLFTRSTPQSALTDMSPALLGLLYISGMLTYQVILHRFDPGLVIYLYGTVWASDGAAYLLGTKFGKHKMYPSMSPNKSWEGAAASVAGGTLGAMILGSIFVNALTFNDKLITGFVIGVVAVIGDLMESMLKRDADVKDSGTFIPGHGGLLDKIDGSLYCGPLLVLILSARGVITEGIKLPF